MYIQQSAEKKIPKSHAHIMMTQMNVKQGIKKLVKKETRPF